jgi:two-component system KDP operon response regulator KdpE
MVATPACALIVEDDRPIRRFLRRALMSQGYQVTEAETGEQGIQMALAHPPDFVLLDLELPDLDGQQVLNSLREWLTVPILVVSARHQEEQKISALDHGADDYLTKPFSAGELLARVGVALRHSTHRLPQGDATVFTCGDLKVDLGARRVFAQKTEIHLTPIEYKILTTLVRYAGKVLTHRNLIEAVWGPMQEQEIYKLRVFMATLRKKIEADSARPRYLLTEPGVGYRLAAD